jgi:hypothetical protein
VKYRKDQIRGELRDLFSMMVSRGGFHIVGQDDDLGPPACGRENSEKTRGE